VATSKTCPSTGFSHGLAQPIRFFAGHKTRIEPIWPGLLRKSKSKKGKDAVRERTSLSPSHFDEEEVVVWRHYPVYPMLIAAQFHCFWIKKDKMFILGNEIDK
jgi:hypothetical protein